MEIFKLLGNIAITNTGAVNAIDETSEKGESLKGKMASVFEKVGSAAVACGKTIATGLAVGATAMAGLTMKALNAAGELEQNMGGSEAVFKEYATGMQETANSAFQNMGLSASDFLATANKMGALFQGSGIEIEKSADLSAQAMQRAADVASIMGIDISAAMESIAGAAKGNFTMMDNLGVAMNETALEAYAMEKGLTRAVGASVDLEKVAAAQDNLAKATLTVESATIKHQAAVEKYGANSTQAAQASIALEKAQIGLEAANRKVEKAMTASEGSSASWYKTASQQEKITLAMEMFMEKTAYAAGNYAKENKTLAGSLTTAKAAMMNFLSGAGNVDGLVKSLVNAGEVIAENLRTLLPRLVEGLNELIDELMPYLPELVEELLPSILDGAVALFNGIVRALPELLRVIIEQLPDIMSKIAAALAETFPVLLDCVKQLFGQIVNFVSVSLFGVGVDFETTFDYIQQIFSKSWSLIKSIWQTMGQPIFNTISIVVKNICKIFADRMPEIKRFVSDCFSEINLFWEEHLKPCFEAIGDFLENILTPAFNWAFNNIIVPVVEKAFNGIATLWNVLLKPVLIGIVDFITGIFSLNIEKAISGLKNIFSSLVSFLSSSFKNGFKNAFEGIEKIIKSVLNSILNGIEKWINSAISAINRLLNGLNDIADEIGDFIGFDLNIPTIRKISLPKLYQGGVLEKGQVGLLEGSGAEAVVPLENNRKWINAVAEDMTSAVGGNEEIRELKAAFEEFVAELPEILLEAYAQMKFDINNREFGRLVKAVK